MMEIWIDIPNYEGQYKVSNYGNIYSIRRNKYLKPTPQSSGHFTVCLPPKKTFHVHSIVLESFKGNPNPPSGGKYGKRSHRMVARHLDGDMTNNHIDNLEWGSYKDNSNDLKLFSNNTKKNLNNRIDILEQRVNDLQEIISKLLE